MQGVNNERWVELCEKAAVEQDPAKLLELTREINRLLNEKRARLDKTVNPT
jgi:hypothetical protein